MAAISSAQKQPRRNVTPSKNGYTALTLSGPADIRDAAQGGEDFDLDWGDESSARASRKANVRVEESDSQSLLSESRLFHHVVLWLILSNTAVVAIETVYVRDKSASNIFRVVELCFTVLYVMELTLRLIEHHVVGFFIAPEWMWNSFDLLITALSVGDALATFSGFRRSNASVARTFRVLRIMRLFRAARSFSDLEYVLTTAVKATMKLGVLVMFVIFVSGIVVTNLLGDCEDEEVIKYFGDLQTSMWSLFKIMTLDHWVPISELVLEVRPDMQLFFVLFIFCGSIALMALVPAIFIELHLADREQQARDNDKKFKQDEQRKWSPVLRHIFRLMDADGNGYVSVKEMQNFLNDADAVQTLHNCGLTEECDLRDVRHGLFHLWHERHREHVDHEVEVTYEEFVDSVLRTHNDLPQDFLHRSATALRIDIRDMIGVMREEFFSLGKSLVQTRTEIRTLRGDFQELRSDLRRTQAEVSRLHEQLLGLHPEDLEVVEMENGDDEASMHEDDSGEPSVLEDVSDEPPSNGVDDVAEVSRPSYTTREM